MSLGIINAVKSQTRGLTSRQRSYNWTPYFVTFSQNMLKFNESTKKKNRPSYHKGHFLQCFVESKLAAKSHNYSSSAYLSFVIKKTWNAELNLIKITKNQHIFVYRTDCNNNFLESEPVIVFFLIWHKSLISSYINMMII